MKKLLIALMLVTFTATLAFASDVVTYENKKGNVTFDHKAHQERAECAKCHGEGEPAKIEVDKDFGHKTCKGCHKEMSGPTKCDGCHKK